LALLRVFEAALVVIHVRGCSEGYRRGRVMVELLLLLLLMAVLVLVLVLVLVVPLQLPLLPVLEISLILRM
jgi:hypothetical protein